MELELRLTNDPRGLPSVAAFAAEALKHLAGGEEERDGLLKLILAATADAVAHAYPKGEAGSVLLTFQFGASRLVVTVRDYGLPQDFHRLEASLAAGDRRQVLGLDWAHFADELHCIGYGPKGKALQIIKSLHDTPVTGHPGGGDLRPFDQAAELAPEQVYEIRRMRPEEAVQVSQLMYRSYGGSYFNPDVYYPERMRSLNEEGVILSFVAVDAAGQVVGHYALEKNQDGPVMEGGQAVVDPAHRGRKLLDRMKDAAIAEGRRLRLLGIYGDAVTVHTFSQKMNIAHGGRLACANLGISPKTEVFRGLAQAEQPQRVSCLLYFLWLAPPPPRAVYAPGHHREALAKLYANLGVTVSFAEGAAASGPGELAVRYEASGGRAFIQVHRVGADTPAMIRRTKRDLIEKSHAEALYVDLPLDQSGTPGAADALAPEGFWFGGIAPHFSKTGDCLRLIYLTGELAGGPIQIAEEIGHWLVGYALADRERVAALG